MNESNVKDAIMSIKIKNGKVYDRIPQRFLVDGIEILKKPLTILFDQIYKTKLLPEQWLIAKIIPVLKKGDPSEISNNRPIANLCSISKIFENIFL